MARINLLRDLQEILEHWLSSQGYPANPNKDFDSLLRQYLNIVRRLPPVVAWKIEISCDLAARTLPSEIRTALDLFIQRAKNGKNLKPYVSTKIEDPDYSDLLFYDWGIFHFHLGREIDSHGFMERTDQLLFALADPMSQKMYLLDILPHKGSFTNQDLIRIIEESWPHIVEEHALRDVIALENPPSNEDIGKLRKKGVNTLIQTPSGRILAPMGGGISTARTSILNTRDADWVMMIVRNVQTQILAKREELETHFMTKHGRSWDELVFRMISFGDVLQVAEVTTQTLIFSAPLKGG